MTRALVLAGHGSHLNARSSEAVRAHARALAGDGSWDEVLVAFWKEEPSLSRALDSCAASEVTVVPVFMSEGYFTGEVIPAEMGLDGPVTRREGRTIRCTRPVGAHPALAGIVVERALEAGARPDDALFVLGHGTPRNAGSASAVQSQVERVRDAGRFAHVAAVFTDQDPNVAAVPDLAGERNAIVVPYFASEGWHVGQVAANGAQAVRYAEPAGTHPGIAAIIRDLALEAARA
ncbi:MAG: cobalamin biosynthesis protein CbiX [Chloroflexota bacterium]|nr:cobalamin biosynthesis protein CbiX [Chloroflexota bacterium]